LTGEIIVVRPRRYHIYINGDKMAGKSSQSNCPNKHPSKHNSVSPSDYCLLSSSDHLQAKSFTTPNQIVPWGSGSVLGSFAEGTFSTSAYWLRTWTQK
jgi:hypothetical protein